MAGVLVTQFLPCQEEEESKRWRKLHPIIAAHLQLSCAVTAVLLLVSWTRRGARLAPAHPSALLQRPLSETLLRRFLLGDDERVLKLDYDDGAQLCKYTTDPWIVHSKQVNFTAHKLNPNKAILLKYMKLCG